MTNMWGRRRGGFIAKIRHLDFQGTSSASKMLAEHHSQQGKHRPAMS
jgi:hypothetical protein